MPADGSRKVECNIQLGCGFIFCRDCRRSFHEGACEAVQAPSAHDAPPLGFTVEEEASLRGRWERDSMLLIQESTKRCPQCSVPVERNGNVKLTGCWYMCRG